MKKDYGKLSVALHEKNVGKISIVSKIDICNIDDISTVYLQLPLLFLLLLHLMEKEL